VIGFDPCGAVMGSLRSCYSRSCIFYPGDTRPTRIHWYWANPGARVFTGDTVFWPLSGQKEIVNIGEPGEQTNSKIEWLNGKAPWPDLVGDHVDGTDRDFLGYTTYFLAGGPGASAITPPACITRPALVLGGGADEIAAPSGAVLDLVGGLAEYWLSVGGQLLLGGAMTTSPRLGGVLALAGGRFPWLESRGLLLLGGAGQIAPTLGGVLVLAGGAVTPYPQLGSLVLSGGLVEPVPQTAPLVLAGGYALPAPASAPLVLAGGWALAAEVGGVLALAGASVSFAPTVGGVLGLGGGAVPHQLGGVLVLAGGAVAVQPLGGVLALAGGLFVAPPVGGGVVVAGQAQGAAPAGGVNVAGGERGQAGAGGVVVAGGVAAQRFPIGGVLAGGVVAGLHVAGGVLAGGRGQGNGVVGGVLLGGHAPGQAAAGGAVVAGHAALQGGVGGAVIVAGAALGVPALGAALVDGFGVAGPPPITDVLAVLGGVLAGGLARWTRRALGGALVGGHAAMAGGVGGAVLVGGRAVPGQAIAGGVRVGGRSCGAAAVGSVRVGGSARIGHAVRGGVLVGGEQDMVPTGAMFYWSGPVAPAGWLLCNGAVFDPTTYPALAAILEPTTSGLTIAVGSPAVFTLANHGLAAGALVWISTTGVLPIGVSSSTYYYVATSGLSANSFQLVDTSLNPVNASGTQSGTHALHWSIYGAGNPGTAVKLPDARGRALVGAGTGPGLTPRALGAGFGEEMHKLVTAETPSHVHYPYGGAPNFVTMGSGVFTMNVAGGSQPVALSGYTGSTGGDAPHENCQPSLAIHAIIKT
jgi:microcystin-dependent protein